MHSRLTLASSSTGTLRMGHNYHKSRVIEFCRMRVHLVDGTYELFRAHYSKRPDHATPDGQKGKATLGLVSSLLQLVADPKEHVTHLAVAFDNPIRSFRNELFAGYKTEEGVEPELLAQFD